MGTKHCEISVDVAEALVLRLSLYCCHMNIWGTYGVSVRMNLNGSSKAPPGALADFWKHEADKDRQG